MTRPRTTAASAARGRQHAGAARRRERARAGRASSPARGEGAVVDMVATGYPATGARKRSVSDRTEWERRRAHPLPQRVGRLRLRRGPPPLPPPPPPPGRGAVRPPPGGGRGVGGGGGQK